MKEKLKIIFDRDGVFNELNAKVADTVGFSYEQQFTVYRIDANPYFSKDVRSAIWQCYANPQFFAELPPAVGYLEIARIKRDPRVHLVVNSLSTTEAICNVKREWDKKHGIDFFDEYLDSCGQHKIMQEGFIQVEDCMDNICRSPAKFKVLINKPYNQGRIPANTFRVGGLTEAIVVIENLLTQESWL